MLHRLIADRHDALSQSGGVPRRLEAHSGVDLRDGAVIPDSEVPLFSLVRSIVGLPIDDPRWWPERPVRRPRGFASWGAAPSAGEPPLVTSHAVLALLGGAAGHTADFAPPTLALLERAVEGLRAWDTTPRANRSGPAGRHALAV